MESGMEGKVGETYRDQLLITLLSMGGGGGWSMKEEEDNCA